MADIDSLAAALFGAKRAETQEVLTDATTRTYVGIALTDSDGGTVMVDLDGDVTLPDDVDGIAEHSAEGVEVATGPSVSEGDEVVVTLVGGTPLKTPMVTGVAGEGDRQNERIHDIEADYVKASTLEADVADIGFLKADSATIKGLQADAAKVHDLTADQLSAAAAYIAQLSADSVTAQRIAAISGDFDTVRANAAKVANLTAAQLEADHAKVGQLDVSQIAADHATIGTLDTTYATIANLNAANGRITNLESTKANISDLEADYIKADEIEATYMHANMSNSDVAWIENGTIKDGAIVSAMINDVSANKLTAGTINGSVINVTNLNADNITTGTINGQRIGEGSLSLDKLSEDVYTEAEVDTIVDGLNDRIDGAIETHTGTAVPTLNNQPASSWNTTALRDEHVGDVYYVVNSQSQQNGYCYRFTKSGSTYSWQLIKDSDVTAALSRLTTAEGKITTFDSDISKLKTDTGTLTTKTESLETRMSDAESDILDKVDTATFNEVSDTVDQHSQTISQHTTAISNKADSSTVTAVTNRVSKNEQDISGINTTIGELQDTVETKADGSTVSTISNKLNTVSDTVDGHTQTLTSVQNALSTKADSSTVSTLSTKVNNVSDTVDGHTSQLSSITSTQTTMQTTLDKTVKSSIQLWYSKANTTAPSKPTSQVTSASTNGNAWRIVVPAYNSSYPHYYYCWQYEYVDGTYGWSAVVRDIAMGESQSTARTADSNASAAVTTANTANTNASTALSTANTANTNASEAKTAATTASTTASEAKTTAETAASDASTAKTNAASAVTTANSASTTATNAQNTANANIKSNVQLWFTKANSTAPSKPTSVVSTSNANTANAWNLVVPVWNKTYPHYYYCYQQQKGDGNYQWTDVVYDRATSEAQQLANTTSTSLSTLQEDYATYKQTTTENVSSIGTRLTTAEGKISTAETAIGQNTDAIALRATKTEVQQVRPAYASSSTAAGTAAKVATIDPAVTGYALYKGASVAVTFSTANTAATPTLNLNSTGAKQIRSYTGAALSEAEYKWAAGATIDLVYDGTYWRMQDGGAVKRVTAAEASIRVNADNIESKVSKDGVISSINQSAETVKIQASKVEIDGTAVFSAISSDVDDAITSKGYQTASQVNSAITSKGYATTTQAQGYATTAKSEAISAAATDATTKANAAEANAKTYTDALEIGGRNLLYDTSDWSKWAKTAKATATDNVLTCANTDTSSGFQRANGWFIPDKADVMDREIVISFDAKKTDSTALSSLVFQMFTTSAAPRSVASGNINEGTRYYINLSTTSTAKVTILNASEINATTWTRVSIGFVPSQVFNTSYTEQAYLAVYIGINNTVASAQFRHIKAEYGNKATDWSPAPEDTSQYRVVTTSYSYTLARWLTYAAEGYTDSWKTGTSGQGVRAGDTVMLKGTNSDNGSAVYVLMTVNTLTSSGAIANATSHGLIDPTAGQRADSAQSTANAAAPKASAVKRTQRIWYRKSASGAPSTPGTASSNWVTKADDGNDAWTKMHIAISSTHKYIYTCEQYEMANGTVGYTSVLLDNTITVIDGGNIITGSVTANKLNAANINASKTLTVGAMTDAAASTILNSNVQVGGRNLLVGSSTGTNWAYSTFDPSSVVYTRSTTATTESFVQAPNMTFEAGETYTLSCWAKSNGNVRNMDLVKVHVSGSGSHQSRTSILLTNEYQKIVWTFTCNATSDEVAYIRFDNNGSNTSGTNAILYIKQPKLERGNKATDWTPAPEDMATAESLAGTNESLEGAITDIGELSDQLVGTTTEQNKTIATIQTYLNSLRKDLDAEIQSRQQWLNFNAAEGLVIGAAGSSFKTVTTNTSQQFRSGGTVLAETSGAEFVAPVMRSDQLLIGNWMWTRRDNGNLSLKWIG